jgi:hypothetical protein
MNEENEHKKIEKEIVIERLRQTPPTFKVSLGASDGKFLNRDDLIEEVKNESKIGEEIINIQLGYLRAFKKGVFS